DGGAMDEPRYDLSSMDGLQRALPEPPDGDQVVLLYDVSWAQYEGLLRSRSGAQPFMAYLDGTLELMSHGAPHEWKKKLLARLVEAFAEETGLALNGFGNLTMKRKPKKAGAEPDECYWIGHR